MRGLATQSRAGRVSEWPGARHTALNERLGSNMGQGAKSKHLERLMPLLGF
jgi:hypothetical protein